MRTLRSEIDVLKYQIKMVNLTVGLWVVETDF